MSTIHDLPTGLRDTYARHLVATTCVRPTVAHSPDGPFLARCGTRRADLCPSCSQRFREDWARIMRSGCLPSDDVALDDLIGHEFYLLTLTAPSFGAMHYEPKGQHSPVRRCRCGQTHTYGDGYMGVPLGAFDYDGAVLWNRRVGKLWDATRRNLRRLLPGHAYLVVREFQARGLLHLHVIIRVRTESAASAAQIAETASRAQAYSGAARWGSQVDCRPIHAYGSDGDVRATARTIGYLAKTLTYTAKSWSSSRPGGGSDRYRQHLRRLDAAAMSMRCRSCSIFGPAACRQVGHQQFGAGQAMITYSREGRSHAGWSLAGLTRGLLHEQRIAWAESQPRDTAYRPDLTAIMTEAMDRRDAHDLAPGEGSAAGGGTGSGAVSAAGHAAAATSHRAADALADPEGVDDGSAHVTLGARHTRPGRPPG